MAKKIRSGEVLEIPETEATLEVIKAALDKAWTTTRRRRSSKPYPSPEQCRQLLKFTNLYILQTRIEASPELRKKLQQVRRRSIIFLPKTSLTRTRNRLERLQQELKDWQANRGEDDDEQTAWDKDEVVIKTLDAFGHLTALPKSKLASKS